MGLGFLALAAKCDLGSHLVIQASMHKFAGAYSRIIGCYLSRLAVEGNTFFVEKFLYYLRWSPTGFALCYHFF